MKRFLKLAFVTIVLSALCACDDKVETPRSLEVTPNNIAGSWRLESSCGEPLADGCYVYIDFVRNDRTYTLSREAMGRDKIGGRLFDKAASVKLSAKPGTVVKKASAKAYKY